NRGPPWLLDARDGQRARGPGDRRPGGRGECCRWMQACSKNNRSVASRAGAGSAAWPHRYDGPRELVASPAGAWRGARVFTGAHTTLYATQAVVTHPEGSSRGGGGSAAPPLVGNSLKLPL